MENDIPSSIQALVVGMIFIFIGLELLITYVPAGAGSAFAHNIGWAFIIGGVISLGAGLYGVSTIINARKAKKSKNMVSTKPKRAYIKMRD